MEWTRWWVPSQGKWYHGCFSTPAQRNSAAPQDFAVCHHHIILVLPYAVQVPKVSREGGFLRSAVWLQQRGLSLEPKQIPMVKTVQFTSQSLCLNKQYRILNQRQLQRYGLVKTRPLPLATSITLSFSSTYYFLKCSIASPCKYKVLLSLLL